jgi:hypothetical protein
LSEAAINGCFALTKTGRVNCRSSSSVTRSKRVFNSEPDVIGKNITLNDSVPEPAVKNQSEVVGVLGAGFY